MSGFYFSPPSLPPSLPPFISLPPLLPQCAIMTYVSSYYHTFSSSARAEQATRRIGKK